MRAGDERRVLDEAGGPGAMTGVMAIMLFLTVLAAALALGTAAAARLLDADLAGKLTVQVPAGDAGAPARVLARLSADPAVRRAVPVDPAEVQRLLAPWLGEAAADRDLPVPALIDVTLSDGSDAAVAAATRAAGPGVAVDRHARWMSTVGGFMRTLTWLGAALVLLMAGASAMVAVLAARAGLARHRGTIEVMHMLGSTDVQVARLFQRRVAIDAVRGGAVGTAAALAVVAAIGSRLAALGSELLGGVALGARGWAALALLPLAFVALAMLAARVTVLRALRRMP